MFIAVPTGMNYRTERLPVVTLSLIGINTLIWLVSAICLVSTGRGSQQWIFEHLWLIPASCTWYAPFTSMFVHAGIFHLVGNMLYLFLFGSCVEDMIGRLRFAIFYLASGFIGEVVYIGMTAQHFHSLIPMGGASGAISGCMGMYLLLRADADIEIKYFFWFGIIRAGEAEIPAWVAIIVWFGLQLLSAVLDMLLGHMGGGVAFGAHIGGFLGGMALLAAYQFLERRREKQAELSGPIIDTDEVMLSVSASPTPMAATSEVPTIYLHDNQRQTGPFTLTHVQGLLQRGEISRDASYWSEGMAEWQSVVDLAGQPLE